MPTSYIFISCMLLQESAVEDDVEDDLTHPIYGDGSKGNRKKSVEREAFLSFLSNSIVRSGIFPASLTFGQAKKHGRLELAIRIIKQVTSYKPHHSICVPGYHMISSFISLQSRTFPCCLVSI